MISEKEINPKDKFLAQFSGQWSEEEGAWLTKVRKEAYSALKTLEFPTLRDEYWKYTRVSGILKEKYTQYPSFDVKTIAPFLIPGLKTNTLVFINGFYSSELSDIGENEKITIEPMAKAKRERGAELEAYYAKYADHQREIFTALNTVFSTNGAYIHVKKNAVIENPVHIINITDSKHAAFNPRNLIVAEENSRVQVILSYETESGSSFTNVVSEVVLKENAAVDLYLLQNESEVSSQINTTQVYQEKSSRFSAYTNTLNGGLVRNNLNVAVDAEACETHLYGFYRTRGKQHVDNHTLIDHKKPHCESNEMYKGILNDRSTGVFNGKVFVRPDAQKINAFQSSQNILMSDDATINSKPELEIYADDVKCSHGSTTGQLDEEAVFYLRSRGISEEQAKRLLLRAFAAEVLENIKIEPLKEKILEQLKF